MGKLFHMEGRQTNIVNKISKTVSEILIYDQIGSDMWAEGITPKLISDELKKIPSNHEINVRINSPGGNVFDGVAIYERLKQDKRKVKCYVDGLAASIASIIALSGDEVIMGDGAMFMLHKPLVGVYGNSGELERMINILDKIEEQMITIYSKKIKCSRLEISNILESETWLTASESVDLGLADKIDGTATKLRVAASALDKSNWIKNKEPFKKQISAMDRQKIIEFKDNVKQFLETRKGAKSL